MVEVAGREILVAEKGGTWLALAATVPFARLSGGYVGRSDGWTDLADNFQMDWEFDHALDGNVALTGELDLQGHHPFTLGLGDSRHSAATTLFQALSLPSKSSEGGISGSGTAYASGFSHWRRYRAMGEPIPGELQPPDGP
jgi:glucoamylase